jgi:AraC family transcriptional regulator
MFSDASVVPFSGKTLRSHSTAGFRLTEKLFGPDRRNLNHAHANAYIEVILKGGYILSRHRRPQTCRPWTIVYHPAGEVHSHSFPLAGVRILIVEIAPQALPWIRECCRFAEDSLTLEGGGPGWLAARLYREFIHSDEISPLIVEALALELLADILRSKPPGSPKGAPEWLHHADELIRAKFAERLTLADIAREVGIHPVNLAQEYRRRYQCTVGHQIRKLRLEFASKQISETNLALIDIALASGFSDQSHFTVAFKNFSGTTPSAYRYMCRETNRLKTPLIEDQTNAGA